MIRIHLPESLTELELLELLADILDLSENYLLGRYLFGGASQLLYFTR
jgi:hypothetical protein